MKRPDPTNLLNVPPASDPPEWFRRALLDAQAIDAKTNAPPPFPPCLVIPEDARIKA